MSIFAARAKIGDFVEYDLHNEDEDWLEEFNSDRTILPSEKPFKLFLYSMEFSNQFIVTGEKRCCSFKFPFYQWERFHKPVLRRLQPPPPVNNTNPYNVFRPREKAHRLHTRRMQHNEVSQRLSSREERKRDVVDNEVLLQRIQMKFKNDTWLLEDSLALPEMPSFQSKFVSSEDEYMESDDLPPNRVRLRFQPHGPVDSRVIMPSAGVIKQEVRPRPAPHTWLHKLYPLEPILLFTKPLVPEKLAAAGIAPPVDSPIQSAHGHNFRGRIGRGGRIVFDGWNHLMHTPIDCGDQLYMPPNPRISALH